jgi:hypothetical protein
MVGSSARDVLKQFAYPLAKLPGFVALYSLVRSLGTVRLEWDGLAAVTRIPPQYRPQ